MRKYCPNCNGMQLSRSHIIEGDAENYIYCNNCKWSEPEDNNVLTLIRELDMVFTVYSECMQNNMHVSANDVHRLIKELYREVTK